MLLLYHQLELHFCNALQKRAVLHYNLFILHWFNLVIPWRMGWSLLRDRKMLSWSSGIHVISSTLIQFLITSIICFSTLHLVVLRIVGFWLLPLPSFPGGKYCWGCCVNLKRKQRFSKTIMTQCHLGSKWRPLGFWEVKLLTTSNWDLTIVFFPILPCIGLGFASLFLTDKGEKDRPSP